MPELPEVETVRRGLEREVVGQKVISAAVSGARTVRRYGADQLRDGLEGRRVDGAARRGKYLVVSLDGIDNLVLHLRMSGQLLLASDPSQPLEPHTHVRVGLDDGRELRFVDPRTFGEMFISQGAGEDGWPVEVANLGIDPIVDGINGAALAEVIAGRRMPLKVALTDQRLVAGIGNIYADEICFRARVRPDRRCDTVTRPQAKRLADAAVEILSEAIAARGSTLRDARYTDLMGEAGSFQHSHAVYGREDEPCLVCGRPVLRIRLGGRSSFYCRRCQG